MNRRRSRVHVAQGCRHGTEVLALNTNTQSCCTKSPGEITKLRTVILILGGAAGWIQNPSFCLMVFLYAGDDRMLKWGIYREKLMHTHTHTPPQGLSGHHCYSGIWDRSRKATPFMSPHPPSAAPPAHCRSMLPTGLLHQPQFSAEPKRPHRKPAFSLLRSYSREGTSTIHCLPPAPLFRQTLLLPGRQRLKTSSLALTQEKR